MDSILSTPAAGELQRHSDTEAIPASVQAKSGAQPLHLAYLDGVRGIAALYVFVFHLWQLMCLTEALSAPHWFLHLEILNYGHFAVDVFIVLSGYCLMLPLAKGNFVSFPKGTLNFIRRRSIRILPPYYAALAVSIALVFFVPSIRAIGTGLPALYTASTFKAAIVTHLFLVHDLWYQLIYKINGPMWSVATEWQIYFIFAFILLPLRNKLGVITPIIFGLLFGAVTAKYGLYSANLWLVASFAVGMAAAEVSFSLKYRELAQKAPLGLLSVAGLLVSAAAVHLFRNKYGAVPVISQDFLIALETALFLVFCSRFATGSSRNDPSLRVYRFFAHPVPVGLGKFSYSLYLIHYPLVCIAVVVASRLGLSFYQILAGVILFVAPAIVGLSYIFFTIFERPFLNLRNATTK